MPKQKTYFVTDTRDVRIKPIQDRKTLAAYIKDVSNELQLPRVTLKSLDDALKENPQIKIGRPDKCYVIRLEQYEEIETDDENFPI